MKTMPFLLGAALAFLGAGCASSTIEKRRSERFDAYQTLSGEQRNAVDQGRIKVGMTSDAVYIALGKPHQVLASETPGGALETWLYFGQYLREYRYWSYHSHVYGGRYCYPAPYLAYDYQPFRYVATEVTFEKGLVKQWRNLAAPQ